MYKANLGPITGAYWLSTLLFGLAGLTSVGTFVVGGALLAGLDLYLLKTIRRQPLFAMSLKQGQQGEAVV